MASGSPGFAQLLGKHEDHLIAVLVPEGCGITVKQRLIDGFGAHHAPGTSPVTRACFTSAVSRSTSAAATRFPKRVSR